MSRAAVVPGAGAASSKPVRARRGTTGAVGRDKTLALLDGDSANPFEPVSPIERRTTDAGTGPGIREPSRLRPLDSVAD